MRRAALIAAAAWAIAASGAFGLDAKSAHPTFRWPLIGKWEKSKGGGLDIAAPEGEPVHAAADGVVIYSGDELKSFGNLVVIRHADDYVTAYAYLQEIKVGQGVEVKRGQVIGKSGKSGDAPKPELHFELRKAKANLDPIGFMAPK